MTRLETAEFERELLHRLLRTAQGIIDRVTMEFEAGLVEDLIDTLGVELSSRGINDLSSEWLHDVAGRIAAGEPVTLPSAEHLETVTAHRSASP